MTDDAARLLAVECAGAAIFDPLTESRRRDGGFAVRTLEALGLLSAADAAAWRDRLARLTIDPAELPLLPRPLREAARTHIRHANGQAARRPLERVGALSWSDPDAPRAADGPLLEIDRVIAVPPTSPPGDVEVASIVVYDRAVTVHAYVAAPGAGSGRPPLAADGSFGLQLIDDRGTAYVRHGQRGGGGASGAQRHAWHDTFAPAPPAAATWLEISAGDTPLARVPLG